MKKYGFLTLMVGWFLIIISISSNAQDTLKIASWNIQSLTQQMWGKAKPQNAKPKQNNLKYKKEIGSLLEKIMTQKNIDITFIQEVKHSVFALSKSSKQSETYTKRQKWNNTNITQLNLDSTLMAYNPCYGQIYKPQENNDLCAREGGNYETYGVYVRQDKQNKIRIENLTKLFYSNLNRSHPNFMETYFPKFGSPNTQDFYFSRPPGIFRINYKISRADTIKIIALNYHATTNPSNLCMEYIAMDTLSRLISQEYDDARSLMILGDFNLDYNEIEHGHNNYQLENCRRKGQPFTDTIFFRNFQSQISAKKYCTTTTKKLYDDILIADSTYLGNDNYIPLNTIVDQNKGGVTSTFFATKNNKGTPTIFSWADKNGNKNATKKSESIYTSNISKNCEVFKADSIAHINANSTLHTISNDNRAETGSSTTIVNHRPSDHNMVYTVLQLGGITNRQDDRILSSASNENGGTYYAARPIEEPFKSDHKKADKIIIDGGGYKENLKNLSMYWTAKDEKNQIIFDQDHKEKTVKTSNTGGINDVPPILSNKLFKKLYAEGTNLQKRIPGGITRKGDLIIDLIKNKRYDPGWDNKTSFRIFLPVAVSISERSNAEINQLSYVIGSQIRQPIRIKRRLKMSLERPLKGYKGTAPKIKDVIFSVDMVTQELLNKVSKPVIANELKALDQTDELWYPEDLLSDDKDVEQFKYLCILENDTIATDTIAEEIITIYRYQDPNEYLKPERPGIKIPLYVTDRGKNCDQEGDKISLDLTQIPDYFSGAVATAELKRYGQSIRTWQNTIDSDKVSFEFGPATGMTIDNITPYTVNVSTDKFGAMPAKEFRIKKCQPQGGGYKPIDPYNPNNKPSWFTDLLKTIGEVAVLTGVTAGIIGGIALLAPNVATAGSGLIAMVVGGSTTAIEGGYIELQTYVNISVEEVETLESTYDELTFEQSDNKINIYGKETEMAEFLKVWGAGKDIALFSKDDNDNVVINANSTSAAQKAEAIVRRILVPKDRKWVFSQPYSVPVSDKLSIQEKSTFFKSPHGEIALLENKGDYINAFYYDMDIDNHHMGYKGVTKIETEQITTGVSTQRVNGRDMIFYQKNPDCTVPDSNTSFNIIPIDQLNVNIVYGDGKTTVVYEEGCKSYEDDFGGNANAYLLKNGDWFMSGFDEDSYYAIYPNRDFIPNTINRFPRTKSYPNTEILDVQNLMMNATTNTLYNFYAQSNKLTLRKYVVNDDQTITAQTPQLFDKADIHPAMSNAIYPIFSNGVKYMQQFPILYFSSNGGTQANSYDLNLGLYDAKSNAFSSQKIDIGPTNFTTPQKERLQIILLDDYRFMMLIGNDINDASEQKWQAITASYEEMN